MDVHRDYFLLIRIRFFFRMVYGISLEQLDIYRGDVRARHCVWQYCFAFVISKTKFQFFFLVFLHTILT